MSFRKSLLWIYDALAVMIFAALLLSVFPSTAFAYVDPSVMTYTIQAVAGVAIALSAVLGVLFRRSRKVVFRLLHIDENANKQVDGCVHRIDKTSPEEFLINANARACHTKQALALAEQPKKLLWWQRFVRSAVTGLFLIGTIFIVAPVEIIAANSADFTFNLTALLIPIFGVSLLLIITFSLVLSLLRGRIFDYATVFFVCLGICCYVQALFFNISLPSADGAYVDWGNYKRITVASTAMWLMVFTVAFVVTRKKIRWSRAICLFLPICLVVVQGVGVASTLVKELDIENKIEKKYVTTEGMYSLSDKQNIIVFIIDALDLSQANIILENNPTLLDEFTGFTYFTDVVGGMVPTRFAIPYLLTGGGYSQAK